MKILRTSLNAIWTRRNEFHVLTYAEEGFSPLNMHTRDEEISKDELVAFSSRVNQRNETGSLFPSASVSAIPRALIRDLYDADALCRFLEDFFRVNAKKIQARKVMLDFRTPKIHPFIYLALERSLLCSEAGFIDEMVVIDDEAS